MPKDIKQSVFNWHGRLRPLPNDCAAIWYIGDTDGCEDDIGYEDKCKIDKWLIEQGCINGEKIIIEYWW